MNSGKVASALRQATWYRWQVVLGWTVAVLLLAACGSSATTTDNNSIQITLLPFDTTSNTLHVQLRNTAQEPITDATVTLEGNMNHAGMAPVLADPVTDGDDGALDGIYQTPFQFSMLGDWIITVTVKQADGSTMTKDINVNVTDTGIQIQDEASSGVDQPREQRMA